MLEATLHLLEVHRHTVYDVLDLVQRLCLTQNHIADIVSRLNYTLTPV